MSGFVAGIKSLTGINQELVVLNRHLEKIVANLNKVKAAAGDAMGEVKKVTTSGGQKAIGTSGNSQMATSLSSVNAGQTAMNSQNAMANSMGKFGLYMNNGGTQILGSLARGGLGIAAAAFSSMPSMGDIGLRSATYYSSTAGFNMSARSLERATFSGLAGSMSSSTSDAAVAGILSGRGYVPGSTAFNKVVAETKGLYNFMGMANETAAQAIGGMKTGSMAAKLYSFGINVTDPRTGKERSTSAIAKQLYERIFPTGANAKDVARSMQYGYLGANLRGLGFDEAQQQIMYRTMLDMAGGGSGDLASKKQGNKFLSATGKIATSEADLMIDKQDAMLKGFEKGAEIVEDLNKAMKSIPDLFYEMNGGLQALAGSKAGQGAIAATTAAFTALTGVIGGLLQILGVSAALKATGVAGGAAKAAGAAGMLGKGAKMAKGAGALAGGFLAIDAFNDIRENKKNKKGLDLFDVGKFAAGGAMIGSVVPGVGTLVGAGVGAAVGLGAGLVTYAMGGDGDLPGTVLPVGDAPVTSDFGAPRTKNGQKTSHHGRDYAVPEGTPVKAARAGIVTFAGGANSHVYGYHIILDHQDGFETLYGHLKQGGIRVRTGEAVAAGQVIGLSGSTGNSTGPHLHFEVRKNGKARNPNNFLSGASAGSTSSQSDVGSDNFVPGAAGTGFITVGISGVSASSSSLSSMYGSRSAAEMLGAASGVAGTYGSSAGQASNSQGSSGSYGSANIGKAGLLQTLYSAGFKDPDKLATAYAVVMAESGGRPNAVGDEHLANSKWGNSIGLFQIRSLRNWKQYNDPYRDASRLYDPEYNAKAGFVKSNGGENWGAWSAYTNGAYKKFLPSKDELTKALGDLGIPATGGASGQVSASFATAKAARNTNVTSINHAGNSVNITVNVAQASEKEARYLASRVKEILENESAISAIGGQ